MSKNHFTTTLRCTCLAWLTACSAGAALAQDLNRVEVSGEKTPRLDVTAPCPSIAAQLEDALARKVWLQQEYGVVDVQLQVGTDGVAGVQTKGGPRVYGPAIRRVIRRMACFGPHAGDSFRFQIAFVPADPYERTQMLASHPGVLLVAAR